MQSIATKTKLSITLALLLALILVSGVAAAQDLGTSGGYDLDALWSAAQAAHDLEREDAVILVESRQVTLAEDGTNFEGAGIPPHIETPVFTPDDMDAGRDSAIEKAMEVLASGG